MYYIITIITITIAITISIIVSILITLIPIIIVIIIINLRVLTEPGLLVVASRDRPKKVPIVDRHLRQQGSFLQGKRQVMRMASSPPRVLAICKTRDRENVPRAVFIFCFFIKLIAPSTQNIQKENSCTNAGTKDPLLVQCAMLQCQVQIQIQLLGNAQRFNECFMHDE